jgi:predicted outer membrane repeat protein
MSLFKMLFKFFIKTACAFSLLFFSLFSYSQTAGDWNSFGMLYRWVDSVTITLTNNITEPFSPAAAFFGEPGRSGNIIDGNGYSFLGNAAIPGPQLDSIFTIGNGKYITFQNTSFEKFNNLNYGIFYISSGSTLSFSGAADIVFSSNSANNKSSSLYIEGSLISNSSVLHFLNNTSVITSPGAAYTSGGGAIRTVGSVSKSTISGSNILFDSNRAGAKGGAIYAESGSILTFGSMPAAMSGVIFRNNSAFNEVSALSQGGALYINNARINFVNASALFDSNSVFIEDNARTGGAVFLENQSVLHFDSSNVDFINNATTITLSNNIAAGAIYAESGALISFNNSRVNFSNNVANVGMDREIAGAIVLDGGSALFRYSTVVFQNNGVSPNPDYSQDTTILINNSASLSFLFSSARFADNTASDFAIGGGAAVKMQAANIYTASLNAQNSEIVFEGNGNSASSLFSGGAIYAGGTPGISSLTFLRSTVVFSNNAAYQGGAFYGANKSEFYFIDSIVKFSGNISQSRGLAFYLANGAKLYFSEGLVGFYNHGDVNLANNIWYAASGSRLSFAGVSVESINNKAAQGGFLDSDKENQDFVFRDVNFEGNTAQNLGGAVYFKNYNIVINGKYAQFSGNTALNGSGGAVHLERSSFSIRALSDIKFFNNEALLGAGITGNPGSGGGIFALNSFVGIYSDSSGAVNTVFEQNKAELAGNVFYLSRSTLSFSNLNANFLNNSGIKGIGIYAFMSQINISGGFLSFSNNAAVEAGAGYLIDKSFLAIRNSSISASYNAADKGTLFYIDASTVLFDGIYRVDFFNNSALGTGASIFYALNSSFTINVLRGGNIYNNEAARFGGIAYFEFSSGSILGSNVADIIISNNSAGQSGGAVEIISSSISFGGRMIFEGNSAIGGNGGAIYIENQSKLTLNSNNGSIVFRNNYAGARLNDIYNHNTSTININGNVNDIVINSGIDGGGWIIKTGRGRLIVGADGGNFNGVFTQSAGSSVFTANSRMFLGNNFIENSLLSITAANPYSFDLIVNSGGIFEYYGASAQTFVIDPAKLRFGNTASNAKMKFGKDSSLSGNASFLLKDELANNALVNEIEFNNADIVFGVAAFNRRNTKYVFKNSTIDLTTDVVIANEVKTTSFSNIETGTSGTYLRFGIYVDASSKLFSDVLFANAGSGRIDLSSQSIVIYKEFPNLLPIVDTYIEFSTRVFRGAANLSFNPLARWTTIITDEYQYIISVDVSSPWASIIFARKPEDSLNIINTEASSDKEYLLTIVPKLNPASDTYHILTDFGFSTDGRFYVSSAPNTPTTVGVEKLSGIFRNDDTQKGSFFKLNGNTQLIIDRLTITNGYASGRASTAPANGSVVNISNSQSSAILRDTIFVSNTASQSGGVFYLNAGVLSIESVSRPISFSNNSAGSSGSGSGGVLYAENAKVFISTINKPIAFSSNSAAVNGGVFSLSNNASLEFFSKISSSILSFSKNSSSNLGGVFYAERGAAIFFNAGAAFEDNSAGQNGGVFALQNAKSSFSNAGTFSFKGNYSANGGVFYLNASSSYFSAFGASFENNVADGAGGAFYLENSFASFILKSANFISNFSQNGSGGAAAFLNSRFEFFGAASFFNNISSGDGGALHLEN